MGRIEVGEFNLAINRRPLFIDGTETNALTSSYDQVGTTKPSWVIFYKENLDLLENIPLADLLKSVYSFEIRLAESRNSPIWTIRRMEVRQTDRILDTTTAPMHIGFDARTWILPYAFIDLAKGVQELVEQELPTILYWPASHEYFGDEFGIKSKIDESRTVANVLDEFLPLIQGFVERVEKHLLAENERSVVRLFDFPLPIRSACEQYLQYFSQFLRDLGIDAETEMKEQASQVLFTVTPVNKDQALDAIRDALTTYLEIAVSPEASSAMAQTQEIAIMQLNANIFHLRSQVSLASAIIQAKDASISAKQSEIELLKQSLDIRGYLPAPSNRPAPDVEQIIEGVVAVKKVDYKGFEFNLPEILRRLKRL